MIYAHIEIYFFFTIQSEKDYSPLDQNIIIMGEARVKNVFPNIHLTFQCAF